MGMSIYTYDCSRCGNEVFSDTDTSLGEYSNFCCSCGYEDSRIAVVDDKGALIPDEDGYIMFEYVQNDGFGILNLEYKDDTRKSTVFEEVPSNEEIIECLHQLTTDDTLLIEDCYLTVWNEDEQKLDVLFGELPNPYGDSDNCEEVTDIKLLEDGTSLTNTDFEMFDDIPF